MRRAGGGYRAVRQCALAAVYLTMKARHPQLPAPMRMGRRLARAGRQVLVFAQFNAQAHCRGYQASGSQRYRRTNSP
jgi:hypothetical protein